MAHHMFGSSLTEIKWLLGRFRSVTWTEQSQEHEQSSQEPHFSLSVKRCPSVRSGVQASAGTPSSVVVRVPQLSFWGEALRACVLAHSAGFPCRPAHALRHPSPLPRRAACARGSASAVLNTCRAIALSLSHALGNGRRFGKEEKRDQYTYLYFPCMYDIRIIFLVSP